MRTLIAIAAVLVGLSCLHARAIGAEPNKAGPNDATDKPITVIHHRRADGKGGPEFENPGAESEKDAKGAEGKAKHPVAFKPLTPEQQDEFLKTRLSGAMGNKFHQFSNMFLVTSRINLPMGVGLMTSSREVADADLRSPFPESYQPTMREFLDTIALQSHAQWKYEPTGKYIDTDEPNRPIQDLAVYEFTPVKRVKPFKVTLAEGWKSEDKGNWVMLIPPSFPVGMDIYEMGTYSTDDKTKEKELFDKVRTDVALQWAQRVNDTHVEDLKSVKIGSHDALFFTAMVPSHIGKDLRWRQWVFMENNRCYFVVSTILPELDKKIYPDVEKMLSTLETKVK
ncbi:MAG: hypothetical protein K8T25_17435 [Planctomycetia bacterium]|nr:hypothetical protein [Planctomycetia bacterium]